jgi:hypothetical protein
MRSASSLPVLLYMLSHHASMGLASVPEFGEIKPVVPAGAVASPTPSKVAGYNPEMGPNPYGANPQGTNPFGNYPQGTNPFVSDVNV